jgi:hypothetical protein
MAGLEGVFKQKKGDICWHFCVLCVFMNWVVYAIAGLVKNTCVIIGTHDVWDLARGELVKQECVSSRNRWPETLFSLHQLRTVVTWRMLGSCKAGYVSEWEHVGKVCWIIQIQGLGLGWIEKCLASPRFLDGGQEGFMLVRLFSNRNC